MKQTGLLMYVGAVVPSQHAKDTIEQMLAEKIGKAVELSDPIRVDVGNYDSIKKPLKREDVHVLVLAPTMSALDVAELVRYITDRVTRGEGHLLFAERSKQEFVPGQRASSPTARYFDVVVRIF